MARVDLRRLPDDWSADDEALLQAVDDATATPVHIGYTLAPEWFDGIADVVDELEACTGGRPDIAVVLIEHVIARLDAASVDDSDGGIVAALERLEPLHAAAASSAGEDPIELGERLVRLAHRLDLEPFGRPGETHGAILGETGLHAVIAAAEARLIDDVGNSLLEHLIADARAALDDDQG